MNFDDVLPYLSRGDFGKYQKKIYFLLCLPSILCAFHKLAGVFLLAVPDHRCKLESESLHNATFELPEDVWRSSIPFDDVKNEYSKCGYLGEYEEILKCSKFLWNTTKVESSAVKSFELVCDRSTLRAAADSLMMIGMLIGCYIFGDLSDKYGRKPVFMVSLLIQVVAGLFVAISSNFATYTIARMFVGASVSGVFNSAYCLALEMVGKESRVHAGVVIQLFYSFGFVLSAGLAYLFRHDWRWFQIAISIPGIVFLLFWWIIPESPRWMLGHGQKSKAVELIKKVAKTNDMVVPDDVFEKLEAETVDKDAKSPSLSDLFKTSNLRVKSILILFIWFVISATYFGLSWSTNDLGGNELLNFFLSGIVEFPSIYFVILTLNRWGRKKILVGSMIASGATLLLALIVPDNQHWLKITLAMAGKGSITIAYSVIFIFSAEQFPTIIRNVALGACTAAATIGAILVPYLIFLGQFWKPALFLIIGVSAFLASICSAFLPETHNKELPETIEDGENLGKSTRSKKVAFGEVQIMLNS